MDRSVVLFAVLGAPAPVKNNAPYDSTFSCDKVICSRVKSSELDPHVYKLNRGELLCVAAIYSPEPT